MSIIDSLSVPGDLPPPIRRVAEECLKEIRADEEGLSREIRQGTKREKPSSFEAQSYVRWILHHLQKLARLAPEVVPDGFISDWARETEQRLQPIENIQIPTEPYKGAPVSGIDRKNYAEQYAEPGKLASLRNSLVAHLHDVAKVHGLVPDAESYLKLAQLWVEIECADRHLDQLAGGGLGAANFNGVLFRPSEAEALEHRWHAPWSEGGKWDCLVVQERAEAVFDLVNEMLVRAPEQAHRSLLSDMERAVNGDACAWERLREVNVRSEVIANVPTSRLDQQAPSTREIPVSTYRTLTPMVPDWAADYPRAYQSLSAPYDQEQNPDGLGRRPRQDEVARKLGLPRSTFKRYRSAVSKRYPKAPDGRWPPI